METEVVGRRERKKLATRAALSEAALRLAVEHGADNVTVERIADEADVALRTFFNYFSSKEEAVVVGDVARSGTLVDALAARPAGEPVLDALRHAALALAGSEPYRDRRSVEQMRALRRTPSLLRHQLEAYAAQEAALADAVATRTGVDAATDLYPALVAAAAMSGLRVVIQRWLAAPHETPDGPAGLIDLVDRAFAHLAAGLGAPLSS